MFHVRRNNMAQHCRCNTKVQCCMYSISTDVVYFAFLQKVNVLRLDTPRKTNRSPKRGHFRRLVFQLSGRHVSFLWGTATWSCPCCPLHPVLVGIHIFNLSLLVGGGASHCIYIYTYIIYMYVHKNTLPKSGWFRCIKNELAITSPKSTLRYCQ